MVLLGEVYTEGVTSCPLLERNGMEWNDGWKLERDFSHNLTSFLSFVRLGKDTRAVASCIFHDDAKCVRSKMDEPL